ncbi:MAG: polysaccharide deacetylase family protein [Candidatus Acidiferrales bacterium]
METHSAIAAAGILCTAAAGISAWGAVSPSSQLFGPTLRRTGNPRTLALTFDDGPNPAVTPALLDLLARHNASATFFLIGQRVRSVPALAREIAARGHAIGNHTETHPALTFLSGRRITAELRRCQEAIATATDAWPRWMRPPFGFRSPMLDGIAQKCGIVSVAMWSVMARDWRPQSAAPVIRRLERSRGGDIVLLHDGDHRKLEGDRMHTVKALEYWLPRWRDAGIGFVTIEQLQNGR